MLNLGVLVDDRQRAWRLVTTGAQAQAQAQAQAAAAQGSDGPGGSGWVGGAGHDYAQDDLGLELDPRLRHEVDALLRRRLAEKRAYRWDEADALQACRVT